MTTLDTLTGSNAGFANIVKAIQSGGAYIDPSGRVLSKTELKPITGYSNTFDIRGVAHAYDENNNLIEIPREPLQLYKFDVAGDGKFTVPKLRNEKEGGFYKDVTLNATKSGNGYTIENTDKTATGQYFQPLKGTDFSNQQWVGMSRGLSNINSAVQSGEATVDTKKSIERWDDGQGNEGSKEYYALRDGNGREVGALYDVPGRADIKYADVGNETAGGGHYVFLQTDPKTGRVAPIQDFGAQVTYRESQGKTFWQQQSDAARAFAPYAAMIFGGPLAAELGGGLLGAAGSAAIFQTAAGVPIEKMAENIATSTLTAGALGASGVDLAGATGGGVTGTMAANTAANLLQGKTLDQALTNAAISTAISTGAQSIAEGQAEDYIQNLPIPDYLNVTTSPTSADVIAAYPELAPQTYAPNFEGPLRPGDTIDSTLASILYAPPTGTIEGIASTLPPALVTDTPIDYSLTPASTAVTVDDVVKNIILENLDTSLQTGTLTADQVDTALNTLTGGYTLGGTTEGIKATLPETIVSGTEPVDYTLNVLTGGEGLKLPTSSNLDIMGGGQGLTAKVDGGVLSEEGLIKTGNVILGDPNSFINTTLPLSTDTIYKYDDGSTLKVDKDGNIIESTDATDTVLDTNLNLNNNLTNQPLTTQQVKDLINAAITTITIAKVADTLTTRNDPVIDPSRDTTITGTPFVPTDVSGWASPTYTQTFQGPIDLNSLFTTENLLAGTQWAGLQGNQFANMPQVSMSDFISSIQNGKV